MPHDEIWRRIRTEATEAAETEPALASYLHTVVLAHDRLEDALSYLLASKLGSPTTTSLTLRTGAGQPLRDFVFEDIHVDEWPAGGRRTLFRCLLPAANTEVRGLRFTRLDTPVANGRIAADGPGSRLSEIVFEGCRVAGLPLRHLSQTAIAIGDNVSAVVIRP